MYLQLFIVGAWLTITPPTHLITDNTSVYIIEFSRNYEVMDTTTLKNIGSYNIVDDTGQNWPIYSVEILQVFDDIVVSDVGTTIVALVTDKIIHKRTYTCTAVNIRDIDGQLIMENKNSDSFYHHGFYPNLFDYKTPVVNLH